MSIAEGQTEQGSDRLERFRALRARLDPAGDPARAFDDGAYVERPGAVSARLAAELAISPASTHLLIGGVGSGKTTELRSTQNRLNQIPDTHAFYVDVSKGHVITKMTPGAVAVQVGLALGEWLQSPAAGVDAKLVGSDVGRLQRLAHGYYHDDHYDYDEDLIHVPGILVSPDKLEESVRDSLEPTKALLDVLRERWENVVVLLDGLDRMTDMAALEQIVGHDIKALKSIGLGVVLVAPLRALYGLDRTLEDRFDSFHYQPWIDAATNPQESAFLGDILRKRIPSDAMDDQGFEALVHASGGVLRDLLALAQSACVEAYIDGSDVIGSAQASAAIDAFGRKHMQGLRPAELEVLQRVRQKGSFEHTSEDDLALLMTRRVLEYRINGRPRYAVHPTIEPFLRDRAGK
jgi:hypothetical protein